MAAVTSGHRRMSSGEQRWADMADGMDTTQADDHRPSGSKHEGSQRQAKHALKPQQQPESYDDDAEKVEDWSTGKGLASVGSRLHDAGRCKPCAFFHTKGCTSAASCLFCHVCPAHEKQRRKRLRRQICYNLLTSYEQHGRGETAQKDRKSVV